MNNQVMVRLTDADLEAMHKAIDDLHGETGIDWTASSYLRLCLRRSLENR